MLIYSCFGKIRINRYQIMKTPPRWLFTAWVIAAALIVGCVPGIKSSKNSANPDAASGSKVTAQSPAPTESPKLSSKDLESLLPPPPPSYKSGDGSSGQSEKADIPELLQKDEINQAAIKFAREVPNVKHVKTCFSKIYGGWYLLLYIEKGKKISLQQYSWNPKSNEWEVVYHIKEVPSNQIEFHLKGEVGDEKCFVLKK